MIDKDKCWTRDEINELVMTKVTGTNRAILALYARQTSYEQDCQATREANGKGFNMMDAKFGTSLAESLNKGYTLSPKQLEAARKMLRKYVSQITNIANYELDIKRNEMLKKMEA